MIQEHPTWWKNHATKINDYLTCPRYFFYRTIVGLKKDEVHNHLAFGSAWHEMMETLLKEGYTAEALANGMERFLICYRKQFGAETDALFVPKTPNTALTAAAHYIQEWSRKDAGQEVLHTEACGAVPIGNDRLIHFKCDSIIRDERGIFSREHKTGSRSGRQWVDQWPLSMQAGTYTHVLYCLYPTDEVWGVEINGTIFQKSKIDFVRVPCRASLPMMEAWLADVNRWVDRIHEDINILMTDDTESNEVMYSFPRNPKSCTDYYGCEYHPFCLSWPNPLQQLDYIPIGYYQEYWDPEITSEDGDVVEEKENLGVLS
jgi:hypothetical protein